MTLQNGLVHGDSAYLWADTAYSDPATGRVLCFESKAFTSTMLFSYAGTLSTIGSLNLHDFPREIGSGLGPLNLAELLDTTAQVVRRWCKGGNVARVLLAAWEDGPRLFMVASDHWHPDVAPYEPAELDSYTSSGNRLAPYTLAMACGWTPERMLAQIDAQRAEPHDNPAAGIGAGHWIGGNAVELRVAASGVTSRVVREWGDAVGERIEPACA